jgi:hypothetical protein
MHAAIKPAAPASRPAPRVRARPMSIKAPKAATAAACHTLLQLPNVGPAMVRDLESIGIRTPQALVGRDGFSLYRDLCRATGVRHDPCVLDTMLAVVDFMAGAPPAPWWAYTARRKLQFGQVPEPFDPPPAPRRGA